MIALTLGPLLVLASLPGAARASLRRNALARTPPMGWMSWELFRCDVVCEPDDPAPMCIGERMYKS